MPSFLKRALYISIMHPMPHNTSFLSYLSLLTLKPSLNHAAPSRKYCSRTNKDTVDMSLFPAENIRNFSIVAHVDHGKSTLADRLLEITGAIAKADHNKQVLDKLQVERERGITVKAQTASLIYNHQGTNYLLNLIDTPGHVDFNYEVSRSLSACQGVLLVVDANQGIQAQTVANFYLAYEAQLSIIPVINKIDLKNADPEMVENQIENTFDILKEDCIRISAKLGTNVEKILQAVIERIPRKLAFLSHFLHQFGPLNINRPVIDIHEPLKALVFDSTFDTYRGVIANIALFSGEIHKGHKITTSHTKKVYEVNEVGILTPDEQPTGKLGCHPILLPAFMRYRKNFHLDTPGQVGYMIAGMREIMDAQIGDTVYLQNQPVEPFPGFKSAKPMVFAGVFPTDQSEYSNLKGALEKLTLNDSSVTVQRDNSLALGAGWRLGFLGLLHMEVFNQRLEQEHNTSVILTAPTVPYKAILSSPKLIKEYRKEEITIVNPAEFPDHSMVKEYLEPIVLGTIVTPKEYIGEILALCQTRRAVQKDMVYMDEHRVMMIYLFPLNEIVVDFFDVLKSLSSGYASFDYEDTGYQPADLVKMDIFLNGKSVEELITIVPREKAYSVGKSMCERLRDLIPRQMFEIAIQAGLGNKIIARETVKAFRKDVLAKCYGGDITRKMKLLKRQAEGKKKMRRIGNVEVPKDTFIKVLKKQLDR